jgi:hypothetical protein
VFPRRDERENDYELQHGGMTMAPPPERRLPTTSRPNSKDVRANNRPGKRVPKKKVLTQDLQMSMAEIMNELGDSQCALSQSYVELQQRHAQETIAHKVVQECHVAEVAAHTLLISTV